MNHITIPVLGQELTFSIPQDLQLNTSKGCNGCNGCPQDTQPLQAQPPGCAYHCNPVQPVQNPAAGGQNRLSTFHTSPQGESEIVTTRQATVCGATLEQTASTNGRGMWQWQDKTVPVFDFYQDPETGNWIPFKTGERNAKVPIEGSSMGEPEVITPKMIIATEGGLAKVVKGRVKVKLADVGKKKPAHRGIVQTFSAGARRRLMRLLAKTNQSKKPLFCTLTYPDVYPDDPGTVKRHLDSFGKRLLRAYPEACFIWRVETVERKSGDNVGKVAPHFHLLVWGIQYKELSIWLPTAWNGVVFNNVADWGGAMADVGGERQKHLRVHTTKDKAVQELKSWRGVMKYASKYIAKKDDNPVSEDGLGQWQWQGKHWGIIGKNNLHNLYLSVVLVVDLAQAQAIKATRLARKMIKLVGRDLQYGLTWFITGCEAVRYVEYLGGSGFPSNALRLSGAQAIALW